MTSDVGIVIPMYNESKVIKNVVTKLKEIRKYDNIILVNDGSKDETLEICKTIPGVYILTHVTNLGAGAAQQTGIEFAKRLGLNYVVTYDADGQHDANDIEVFVNLIKEKNYDLVLGSRFLGKTINMPKLKGIVLKTSIWFGYIFGGIKLTDSHNGFKVINLKNIPDFEFTQNGMSHGSEIIDIIKRKNLNYVEYPHTITYTDYSMEKGQSISNSINIVVDYLIKRRMK